MKNYISITIFIAIMAGLLSCQKKEEVPLQPDEVKIVVTTPQEGQIYKWGDTVFIRGNISYTGQLHGYIARITDEQGAILYEGEGHTHGSNLPVNEQWVNMVNKASQLRLELTTVIDHNENKKTVNVAFSSQP